MKGPSRALLCDWVKSKSVSVEIIENSLSHVPLQHLLMEIKMMKSTALGHNSHIQKKRACLSKKLQS